MILVVGLSLAAILQIVIPLGAADSQNWPLIIGTSTGCLAVAGFHLYFWIVVLELFIKMGPFYEYDGAVVSQAPPIPVHQVRPIQFYISDLYFFCFVFYGNLLI